MSAMTDLGVTGADGWTRLGTRPGPRMWAKGFMRIERYERGTKPWRVWDVLRVPQLRPMHPTTFHRTLTLAKAHGDQILGAG